MDESKAWRAFGSFMLRVANRFEEPVGAWCKTCPFADECTCMDYAEYDCINYMIDLYGGEGEMTDGKVRRAFQNYVLDQLEEHDKRWRSKHAEYVEEWGEGLCDCCSVCDCVGACGTDRCIDKLIEYYGGDSDD